MLFHATSETTTRQLTQDLLILVALALVRVTRYPPKAPYLQGPSPIAVHVHDCTCHPQQDTHDHEDSWHQSTCWHPWALGSWFPWHLDPPRRQWHCVLSQGRPYVVLSRAGSASSSSTWLPRDGLPESFGGSACFLLRGVIPSYRCVSPISHFWTPVVGFSPVPSDTSCWVSSHTGSSVHFTRQGHNNLKVQLTLSNYLMVTGNHQRRKNGARARTQHYNRLMLSIVGP